MLPIMKRHKNCPLKEVKEVKKNKWNEGYDAGMKRAYEQMLEAKENSVKEWDFVGNNANNCYRAGGFILKLPPEHTQGGRGPKPPQIKYAR